MIVVVAAVVVLISLTSNLLFFSRLSFHFRFFGVCSICRFSLFVFLMVVASFTSWWTVCSTVEQITIDPINDDQEDYGTLGSKMAREKRKERERARL